MAAHREAASRRLGLVGLGCLSDYSRGGIFVHLSARFPGHLAHQRPFAATRIWAKLPKRLQQGDPPEMEYTRPGSLGILCSLGGVQVADGVLGKGPGRGSVFFMDLCVLGDPLVPWEGFLLKSDSCQAPAQ